MKYTTLVYKVIRIRKSEFVAKTKFLWKELTLCNKLWFSNPYIFGFQSLKPLKFQTMTFVRSKNISLKSHRFTKLGSKDIGIRKSEFVAKCQFLYRDKRIACWKYVTKISEIKERKNREVNRNQI